MKHENDTIQKPVVRNQFTTRIRTGITFNGPSRTKQEFKDECDINNIMRQYQKTGLVEHVNKYQGRYGDLANAVDFHTAQNILIAAQSAFNTLTAKIRDKFHNDPGEFLQFVQDPKNRAEMAELGLLKPQPPQDRTQVQAPDPTPAPSKPGSKKPVKGEVQDFDPSD